MSPDLATTTGKTSTFATQYFSNDERCNLNNMKKNNCAIQRRSYKFNSRYSLGKVHPSSLQSGADVPTNWVVHSGSLTFSLTERITTRIDWGTLPDPCPESGFTAARVRKVPHQPHQRTVSLQPHKSQPGRAIRSTLGLETRFTCYRRILVGTMNVHRKSLDAQSTWTFPQRLAEMRTNPVPLKTSFDVPAKLLAWTQTPHQHPTNRRPELRLTNQGPRQSLHVPKTHFPTSFVNLGKLGS